MRLRALGRALGFVDRLVEALEPVQQPQLVGDDAVVFGGERLLHRRQSIEPRLSGGVSGERARVIAFVERRIRLGDRTRPSRVRNRDAPEKKQHHHRG